jgi:hypothetical protein
MKIWVLEKILQVIWYQQYLVYQVQLLKR